MTCAGRIGAGRLAAVFCLAAAFGVAVAARQNPYPKEYQFQGGRTDARELEPAWTLTLPSSVAFAAVSPDGSCVAVVAQEPRPGRVVAIDREGRRAWDFAPPATLAGPVAVAPACDWVAFDVSQVEDRRLGPSTGIVAIRYRSGETRTVPVQGRPETIAVSHAGDLLAIGTTGIRNLALVSSDGRLVRTLERLGAAAPRVSFSVDDRFIVVNGWYGVGVLTRDGDRVWGPWPAAGDAAKRRDWRTIDASRDLQWFAAQQGPMHGSDGGSFALLTGAGDVAWQGPPVWEPDAKVAPDGSYFVAVGRDMGRGGSDDRAPARVAVIDRTGRTLASKILPRPALECITAGGRFIVSREVDPAGRVVLVGRDRTLTEAWSVSRMDAFASDAESGLIVAWTRGRISGYLLPK